MTAKLEKLGISPRRWAFLRDDAAYKMHFERMHKDLELRPEPLKRQLKTAKEILRRLSAQKGVMLADDVGLGKTSVGAVVACVFAGSGKKVRILAPNATMRRRWRREIGRQLPALAALMRSLPRDKVALDPDLLDRARKRMGSVWNVVPGDVQVTTHLRGAKRSLDCDLLIIDEAHRARTESSKFGKALARKHRHFKRVLLVTATPFSLSVNELSRALRLLGADVDEVAATQKFGKDLDKLWSGKFSRPEAFGKTLGLKGAEAIGVLKDWVIRHSVSELSHERDEFGEEEQWLMAQQQASPELLEVVVRTIRLLQLARDARLRKGKRINDPRFHQGWAQLKIEMNALKVPSAEAGERLELAAIRAHRRWVGQELKTSGVHEKVRSVAAEIQLVVEKAEKVLVFCDHHVPAQELTVELAECLTPPRSSVKLSARDWMEAWASCLRDKLKREFKNGPRGTHERYRAFLRWLSCGALRNQVGSWLTSSPTTIPALHAQLRSDTPRARQTTERAQGAASLKRMAGGASIADEAARLFRILNDVDSASTRGFLDEHQAEGLPGWGKKLVPVMSSANRPEGTGFDELFFAAEPDTLLAVFNSPFGPDVLVATDRLSEGIDLHTWCRHLVHYELDPSPIRTIQRRGRLRRINSWASRTGEPMLEAFPRLGGTRDGQLVGIVTQRLKQFELLLGGIATPVDPEAPDVNAERQVEALEAARRYMGRARLGVV